MKWQYRQQSLPCVKKPYICFDQLIYPSPRRCTLFANSLLLELVIFFINLLGLIRYSPMSSVANISETFGLTMRVSKESQSMSTKEFNSQNRSRGKTSFKIGFCGLQYIFVRFK